jgi:hypothetical protein
VATLGDCAVLDWKKLKEAFGTFRISKSGFSSISILKRSDMPLVPLLFDISVATQSVVKCGMKQPWNAMRYEHSWVKHVNS